MTSGIVFKNWGMCNHGWVQFNDHGATKTTLCLQKIMTENTQYTSLYAEGYGTGCWNPNIG
jgi:hypothetical protein